MTHRDVELLAIGAGPANLALAVALDETAPKDLAEGSLLVERDATIAWQRGMLLPWTQSQVSFLKDFVTLRDPCSKFTFLNYLHSVGRLDDFINLGSFTPYRIELSGYLKWVAESLEKVRVECNVACEAIEPCHDGDGTLSGWLTHLSNGSTVASKYLVLGAGRDPHVPPVLTGLPSHKVIHSTVYSQRIAELRKDVAHRVVVVGGAQSAAEMFYSIQDELPLCQPTMVMRSIGLNNYELSKFTNELYFPSFVDKFFNARPEARAQLLQEMYRSNYGGLTPSLLDALYRRMYLERLNGQERMRIITMVDITAAREDGDDIVLELTDRRTGTIEELRCDVVLLGTGFARRMPRLVQSIASALGIERIEVTRDYRLVVDGPATAACYLQGVNEATHGIADSLLSVLAVRAGEIATDIVKHRDMTMPDHEATVLDDLIAPVGAVSIST
ncbi:MAG: lysine N(6)-hydroxylase/L-ornithine N(5)-oxygenase family protein [Frankiaceae bacterium]